MDEYGTDALRFTLAIMAAQGRDVRLDTDRIAGYRNFGTKLWNATRFAQMNGVAHNPNFKPDDAKLPVNRWILTELSRAIKEVSTGIDTYRFNDAASGAYKFLLNGLDVLTAYQVQINAPDGCAQIVVGDTSVALPLGSLVDKEAEIARIEKAIGKVRGDMAKIEGKLNNERFVQNAKPEIVAAEREKLKEFQPTIENLEAALARIKAL
ncbi:Valine--tRNA ligase [Nymphon striatum]|nr:Valine--tRNA ligase [Nymphon striatum]